MSAPKRVQTTRVDGPDRTVHVLFYDDGSVRIRLSHAPYFLEEAFIGGNPAQNAVLKLTPR